MLSGGTGVWLVVNLGAGGIAAAIYGLWAVKWVRHRVPLLVLLNLLVSLACLGFALGYALLLHDEANRELTRYSFRVLAPVILLAPAVTRYVELRREERREAVGVRFTRALRKGS